MILRKRQLTGTTSSDVTIRELQNRHLARVAAGEGFVLLKNEDSVLPIEKGSKIGLYGAGAQFTVKGGTGSGDVNERGSVSIYEGLMNAGYEITSKGWLSSYVSQYNEARLEWRDIILGKATGNQGAHDAFSAYVNTPFVAPLGYHLDKELALNDGADTAIFVLRRVAGEGKDRSIEGDYLLSPGEKEQISEVCECYKNVVLVINAGSVVDLGFTDEHDNIKGIILFVQGGQEGGNALGDVITGAVTPSGKLTDSWAYDYYDYPSASTFSYLSGNTMQEDYNEGIYVGYRYFEAFNKPVR